MSVSHTHTPLITVLSEPLTTGGQHHRHTVVSQQSDQGLGCWEPGHGV